MIVGTGMNKESNKVNMILHNKRFKEYLDKNVQCEETRKFCRHNLQHLLDVARIAYIANMEDGLGYSKDVIYGAALLHDIGKWQQYLNNIPHEIASTDLSIEILKECGYEQSDIELIKSAIINHRKYRENDKSLDYIIYFADKASRNCFACDASAECNWDEDQKTKGIVF